MSLILADEFDADVSGQAPTNWTVDGAAWTALAAPSGLAGLVARAAQNNVTDQFLSQTFTRKTAGVVALRFKFKTGASVGTNLRWADALLFDGASKIARLIEFNGGITIQNNNASVSTQLVASAANTVYSCILFVDLTNAKMWAYINGTLYDNGGAKYTLNLAAGLDTVKFSNYGGSASSGGFVYLDDIFLASYAAGASPTGVPTVGSLTASGTVNGKTCGGDKNARIRLKYTEAGSGQATDRVALYRASMSGGSFSKVGAIAQDSISAGGSPNAWEAVDRRPQWGSPAIAYGGTAYYKAAGENVFGESVAQTSEVNAVADVDLTSCESTRAASLSAIMAGAAVASDSATEEYPGYWMTAMAYAYRTFGIAQYKTDCLNQFNYIKTSLTNPDGLIQLAGDAAANAIFRDHHSRTVIHAAIAARLLRAAGAFTDAATIIAQCDVWAKAFFDKLNSGNPAPTQRFTGWDANNTTGLGYQQAWQASHAYALGEVRRPTSGNGHTYRVTTPGTSGSSEPTWPTSDGGTVTDGTVVWTETAVTVACSYAQYDTTTGYPGHSSGQHASDLNQNAEEGLMCALLLTDPDSSFLPSGTYRTKALNHVTDQVKLVLAHETSAGAITLGTITGESPTTCTAKHNYDSLYGNYAMQQLSAIQALMPTLNAYLAAFISRGMSFSLSTFYGTEPPSRRRYNIADPGVSTAVPFYDFVYLDAAARVANIANPQSKLVWTAAFQLAASDRVASSGYSSIGAPSGALADQIQAEMLDGPAYTTAVLSAILDPIAIPSAEFVSTPLLSPWGIAAVGIASAESVLAPVISGAAAPVVPSIPSAEVVPGPALNVPVTPIPSTARDDYDIRLGPLWFIDPLETVGESVGDGLEAIGAALTVTDRRPRPLKLKLPVRGSHLEADPTAAGTALRRAVRALFDNARWRLEGFFFTWSVDPDLDCWLKIGGGDLSETDPGISFGEYELDLEDVYIVGRPGSHRPGRRAVIGDRRSGLVARDTRQRLLSTDFASYALPSAPLVIPGDVVSTTTNGNSSVSMTVLGPLRSGRRLWRSVPAVDGEVVTYVPNRDLLPDRARYLDLDAAGAVRIWSLAGAPEYPPDPATYTTAGDSDPDLELGWERVFGGLLSGDEPLAMDNGVCRLIWLGSDPAQGLALEYWDGSAGHFQRVGRVLHAAGVTEVRVIELTAERAVVEWRAGRYAMRAILQRGWWGPRLEAYDDEHGDARLEYAPLAGGTASYAAQSPSWVQSLTSSGAGQRPILWAQASSDEVVDTIPAVIDGSAVTFRRESVVVAQLSLPGGPTAGDLASLSLVDARAVPVLVGV